MDIKDIIIYEDNDIIVVEKPRGVASQTERGAEPDMVSMLMNYFSGQGSENPYVGVVHRLDKNVGGVMVYAKNKHAASALSLQMTGRTVVKKYYAAVYGSLSMDKEGTMEDMLARDSSTNTSRVADSGDKSAKKAELSYRVKAHGMLGENEVTILDITLLTGRHHQIRVQLSSRGYPLVGDRKYGGAAALTNDADMGGVYIRGYIGLYCYTLTFIHPVTGKHMTFSRQPKDDIMRRILEQNDGRPEEAG